MEITINKLHITELYIKDKKRFLDSEDSPFRLIGYKGEEIDYLFFRLWRKKYYAEDTYRYLFCFDEVFTKTEVISYIKENLLPFENEHLYEDINDKEIYIKPHVVLKLMNGSVHHKYFNTYEECEEFIKIFKNEYSNLITIEI